MTRGVVLAPGRGTRDQDQERPPIPNTCIHEAEKRAAHVTWPGGLGTRGGASIGNWVSLGSWAWDKDVDDARNRAEGGGCGEAPTPPLLGVGRYAPCTTSRPCAVLLTRVPGLLAAQT